MESAFRAIECRLTQMNAFSHYCLTFSANDWVFYLNEQQNHRVFILDQWVFVLDHRVFVLDHRVFVLDHWVFVLDHRVLGLRSWVFVLDTSNYADILVEGAFRASEWRFSKMNVFSHYCLTLSANDCVFSPNELQRVSFHDKYYQETKGVAMTT